MSVTIRFRRGRSSEWQIKNPIIAEAEPAYETDTGGLKMGDGVTPYNELSYCIYPYQEGSGGEVTDEALLAHINSLTPHPVYDDGPSLVLLYENVKAG